VDAQALTARLSAMRPRLDERQWRALLGAEANAIGRGGIGLVARVAQVSNATVSRGAREARQEVVADGRIRAAGAGRPRVLLEIILPSATPALATLAIFAFTGSWNEFFWPLIVTAALDVQVA